MKIAVPTKDNFVDDHFGHCAYYTIYAINDSKEVLEKEILESPQGCGCKSNIAEILRKKNVTVMLAGNMGDGAVKMLGMHQIKVIRGCKGNTDDLVVKYLKGEIIDSEITCYHHGHEQGHQCGGH